MIPGICDTPDRIPARLYRRVRTDCPCCTFVRGVALGVILGAALASAGVVLSRFL